MEKSSNHHHYLGLLNENRPYLQRSEDRNQIRKQKAGVPKRQIVGVKKTQNGSNNEINYLDLNELLSQQKGDHLIEVASKNTGQSTSSYNTNNNNGSDDVAVARINLSEKYINQNVFEHRPLIILPLMPLPEDYQVCIDCCNPISWGEPSAACIGCGWSCCSQNKCDPRMSLHTKEECALFAKLQQHSLWTTKIGYSSLCLIRLLLLKKQRRQLFDYLMKMATSVMEKTTLTQKDLDSKIYSILWLRSFHRIHERRVTDEEISRAWMLIRFSCFHVPNSSPSMFFENYFNNNTVTRKRAKMIYPYIQQLFPHSCFSNSTFQVQINSCNIKILLQSTVAAGKTLTINYNETVQFQPFWKRRERLWKIHNIQNCTCSLCLDESEFGTYFSAIPCHGKKTCKTDKHPGFLVCRPKFNSHDATTTTTTTTDNTANNASTTSDSTTAGSLSNYEWKCTKCSESKSHKEVLLWIHSVEQGFEKFMKSSIDETPFDAPDKLSVFKYIELLLSEKVLHDTHHLLFQYSVSLLDILLRKIRDLNKRVTTTTTTTSTSTSNNNDDDNNDDGDESGDMSKYYYSLFSKCILPATCVDKILRAFLNKNSHLSGTIPRIVALIKIHHLAGIVQRKKEQWIHYQKNGGEKNKTKSELDLHHIKDVLERYVIFVQEEDEYDKNNSSNNNPINNHEKNYKRISIRTGPLKLFNALKIENGRPIIGWKSMDFKGVRKLIKYTTDYITTTKISHLPISKQLLSYFDELKTYSIFFGGEQS